MVPEWQTPAPARFTSKTSDLIIKSGRNEFPGLAINEFLCMSVAKEAGISVPEFYLSDNTQLFIMRRFDRDAALNPIGFEDMAALMGSRSTPKVTRPLPKPFVCSVPLSKYSPHCISCLPS